MRSRASSRGWGSLSGAVSNEVKWTCFVLVAFVAAWRLSDGELSSIPEGQTKYRSGANRIISRKLAVAYAALFVGSPLMRYGQPSPQEAMKTHRWPTQFLVYQREQALSGQVADQCNSARLYCAFRVVLHEACEFNQYANRCQLARNKSMTQRGNHVRTGKARARSGMASRS